MFNSVNNLSGPGSIGGSPMIQNTTDSVNLKKFQDLLQQSMSPQKKSGAEDSQPKAYVKQLTEAAKQMEIQMVTMMFKTMEKTSSENGMLGGGKSAGMAHFKDMFFIQVAEEVVDRQGLGFAENLLNAYETKHLNR